ncbi:MAG TPA: ferric uptake regulator family protein, partial [Thiolapillus brandeum]|nr:ferric uptake regulator family protein [Thiolapillus brandeum]
MNNVRCFFILYLALTFPASALAIHNVKPYFSAPYTGEKVQEYEITLPLSRHEKASFVIPRDCKELNSRLLEGNGHWGNRIEKRLWIKVDDDCRYVNFLKRYPE